MISFFFVFFPSVRLVCAAVGGGIGFVFSLCAYVYVCVCIQSNYPWTFHATRHGTKVNTRYEYYYYYCCCYKGLYCRHWGGGGVKDRKSGKTTMGKNGGRKWGCAELKLA